MSIPSLYFGVESLERKWDNWETRAQLWGMKGREMERQRPKNCPNDGVTVRSAAAVVSLVSPNGQSDMDFPAFQCGWVGRKES